MNVIFRFYKVIGGVETEIPNLLTATCNIGRRSPLDAHRHVVVCIALTKSISPFLIGNSTKLYLLSLNAGCMSCCLRHSKYSCTPLHKA